MKRTQVIVVLSILLGGLTVHYLDVRGERNTALVESERERWRADSLRLVVLEIGRTARRMEDSLNALLTTERSGRDADRQTFKQTLADTIAAWKDRLTRFRQGYELVIDSLNQVIQNLESAAAVQAPAYTSAKVTGGKSANHRPRSKAQAASMTVRGATTEIVLDWSKNKRVRAVLVHLYLAFVALVGLGWAGRRLINRHKSTLV